MNTFTVITMAGSIHPIAAENAAEACQIIDDKHGWTAAYIIAGEFAIERKEYAADAWMTLVRRVMG